MWRLFLCPLHCHIVGFSGPCLARIGIIVLEKREQVALLFFALLFDLCLFALCLRSSQPNGVMSSAVSLPNHTFTS